MNAVLEFPTFSHCAETIATTPEPPFERRFRAIPMRTGIYCQNCAAALACDDTACGVCGIPTLRAISGLAPQK